MNHIEAIAANLQANHEATNFLPGSKYQTRAEHLRDVKNPSYRTSAHFRDLVDTKLAASTELLAGVKNVPFQGVRQIETARGNSFPDERSSGAEFDESGRKFENRNGVVSVTFQAGAARIKPITTDDEPPASDYSYSEVSGRR
jgi:hypothetical protein